MSDKIFPRHFIALLMVSTVFSFSVYAGAIDIPEKVCASGAVDNNSVALYVKGSIGQPVIQNCNSVNLYLKSGFFRAYSALKDAQCLPGDANNDKTFNILDVVYLINYKYKNGPAPVPDEICSADANCSCDLSILDAVFLINFKYKAGLPPCGYSQWRSSCEQ